MITKSDFDQIKFNFLLKGQISSEDAKELIDIVSRIKDDMEMRIDSSEIYYEEEQRMISEVRNEMAHEILEGMFNK